MARRHTVADLNEEQLDFVLRCFADNDNDREVSLKFEEKFKAKLAKSSLHRWRKASGDELIERYRLARFQAKALREQLGENKNDYEIVMQNIEERLLTATREVIKQNPMKLLFARQEEERLRLKREKLELEKQQHEFEREKFERTQNLEADKFRIASEAWKYILAFFTNMNSPLVDGLTAHSSELLEGLGEHIEQI